MSLIAVPGTLRRDARPPIETDAAPAPGIAQARRPTAIPRRWVRAGTFDPEALGHEPADPAVRRFWTAVVGPGAVADLLRLTAAARSGRSLREPLHVGLLAAEDLVRPAGGMIWVRPRVAHLGPRQLVRLAPALRAEYLALLDGEPT